MEVGFGRSLVGVPGGTLSIDRKEMGPKPQTFRAGESLPEGRESGGWLEPATPLGSSREWRRVAPPHSYLHIPGSYLWGNHFECRSGDFGAETLPQTCTQRGGSLTGAVAGELSRQIAACFFYFSAGSGCRRCRSTCTPRSATSGGRTPSILPAAPRVAGLI